MGSVWQFTVGGRLLMSGKNYLPDKLLTVFTESDRYEDQVLLAKYEDQDEYVEEHDHKQYEDMLGYRTSTAVLKTRLALMGFQYPAARSQAVSIIEDMLEEQDPDYLGPTQSDWQEVWKPILHTASNALEKTVHWVLNTEGGWRHESSKEDLFYETVWEEVWETIDDPRFLLSLLTSEFEPSAEVRLNVTDLYKGEWFDRTERAAEKAAASLSHETAASGRIIVITEGSTDAEFLSAAFRHVAPDVVDYFSFLDFETKKNPGGTDRVVSLARGLASAGIMNRVVVVLDNDVAGREAERQLQKPSLPNSFEVIRLPEFDYARSYPTIGPTGRADVDINGRACSIEFIFGAAVLRESFGGQLPPVRWKAEMQGIKEYQGELTEKGPVQAKIRSLLRSPSLPEEVAQECRKTVDAITQAALRTARTIAHHPNFTPVIAPSDIK